MPEVTGNWHMTATSSSSGTVVPLNGNIVETQNATTMFWRVWMTVLAIARAFVATWGPSSIVSSVATKAGKA